MRADRLVSILLLLQSNGQMTAKQLAEKLEVSARTIYRDMDALSAAGIPVFAERGTGGGWRLLEEYRTNLTGLKEAEIDALFVPPSGQLLEDLGLLHNAENARNKLLAALPPMYHRNAKDVWNRIHVDTSMWKHPKEKIHSFETIKKAVWTDRKLNIRYERADGKTIERTVEPLGLVAKGSTWYLIASVKGEIRNYRASRIQSAALGEETFLRPENFDLAEYWKSSTKTFIENLPKYEVCVEVTSSILPRLKFGGRFVQVNKVGKLNDKGWTPVSLSFDSEAEAKEYILGFGDQIKVIQPKNWCDHILKKAERTVAFLKSM